MTNSLDATIEKSAGFAKYAQAISSPIALLAFVGAVVEAIIAILIVRVGASDYESGVAIALISAVIVLPIILMGAIYRLISRYPENLYTPWQYGSPELFVGLVERRLEMSSIAEDDGLDRQQPFILSASVSPEEVDVIERRVATWEPVLRSMDAAEFRLLHSWYNEHEVHDLAALCLDIAIAKGSMTSSNYSFRSASLRKLGRLRDALYSARIALDIDSLNLDAEYNAARTLCSMGLRDEALGHARKAAESHTFRQRLLRFFPELASTEVKVVHHAQGDLQDTRHDRR